LGFQPEQWTGAGGDTGKRRERGKKRLYNSAPSREPYLPEGERGEDLRSENVPMPGGSVPRQRDEGREKTTTIFSLSEGERQSHHPFRQNQKKIIRKKGEKESGRTNYKLGSQEDKEETPDLVISWNRQMAATLAQILLLRKKNGGEPGVREKSSPKLPNSTS